MGQPVGKTDIAQKRPGEGVSLLLAHTADERGHHDVFQGGKLGKQVVKLEYESDGTVSERGQGAVSHAEDILPAKADGP